MTKEEQALLGHAYWDGKMLQFLHHSQSYWVDWVGDHCPDFIRSGTDWRIKDHSDEPQIIYEVK